MKNSIKTLAFSTVLILFIAFSCSKKDDSELVKEGGPFKISELAGNWEATSAFFGRDNDNVSVDIIADGGSLFLTVQSSGRCIFTVDPFDREAYTVSGEMFWELYEGDYFFAIEYDDYPGDWASYGAILTDTIFTMNGGSDSGEYDFDNDGTSESARIGFEFIRV
jgi:hypothetical protein